MNDKPKPQPTAHEPGEKDLVDLLDQHRQEAETHELHHKGLLADHLPVDHDHRHANPLKPSHSPDEPHSKKHRDLL